MEAKAKLNVEYIEMDPTVLQMSANFLKPAWIFLYFPKSRVKIEYFLFVSTHVPSLSLIYSANAVVVSMFTVESEK